MANAVTCDECGKEFNMRMIDKPHGRGIIETFFDCPHCKKRYNVSVTDDRLRKEQNNINALNNELIERKQKLLKDMAELEREIAST